MGTLLEKVKAITKRIEKSQEEIVFAQAGHSTEPSAGKSQTTSKCRKLLVVGHENTFSRDVMEYALEMAKRMSYEILALNTAPLSCNALKALSTSQRKICDEFKELSEQNAQAFKQAAEQQGIEFTHVVKYDEPDQALDKVQRQFTDIEFVISDQGPPSTDSRVADEQRPERRVYVYSMI